MIEVGRSESFLTFRKRDDYFESVVGVGKDNIQITKHRKMDSRNDYGWPYMLGQHEELALLLDAKKEFVKQKVMTPQELELLEKKISSYPNKIHEIVNSVNFLFDEMEKQ